MHATICILLLHAGLAAAYSLTARPAILRQHRLAAMCASSDGLTRMYVCMRMCVCMYA